MVAAWSRGFGCCVLGCGASFATWTAAAAAAAATMANLYWPRPHIARAPPFERDSVRSLFAGVGRGGVRLCVCALYGGARVPAQARELVLCWLATNHTVALILTTVWFDGRRGSWCCAGSRRSSSTPRRTGVCVCVCVCVCACVRLRARAYTRTRARARTHTHTQSGLGAQVGV